MYTIAFRYIMRARSFHIKLLKGPIVRHIEKGKFHLSLISKSNGKRVAYLLLGDCIYGTEIFEETRF